MTWFCAASTFGACAAIQPQLRDHSGLEEGEKSAQGQAIRHGSLCGTQGVTQQVISVGYGLNSNMAERDMFPRPVR